MATRFSIALAASAALAATPVAAQLLPGSAGGVVGGVLGGAGRTVGGLTQPILNDQRGAPSAERAQLVAGAFDRVTNLASSVAGGADSLLDLRKLRLSLLANSHKAELARDPEQPGIEPRAHLPLAFRPQRTLGSGLHQIVGIGPVAAQRVGKAAQPRHMLAEQSLELEIGTHATSCG